MRRLLITGGAGFIGTNFVYYWHHHFPNDRLVVLDALTYAGNRANLAGLGNTFRFVQGNICDRALLNTLLTEEAIDTIVNFAAESHVDRSISGPAAFIQTNLVGTFTLLEAFRDRWQRQQQPSHYRFHHISTDEVYGSLTPDAPSFSETTPYAPNSPYSASKAGSDHLVRAYHHTYGLPTLITNCSNNYGPYQFPEKLLPLMMIHILQGKPLPVYGDGSNIRDWLYVGDHCSAIATVLQQATPGTTYNIGGNSELANIDLVKQLCNLMDSLVRSLPVSPASQLITFVPDRPGHDQRYSVDFSKIQTELGWSPKVSLKAGLQYTIQWYLAHQDWWQPLISKEKQ